MIGATDVNSACGGTILIGRVSDDRCGCGGRGDDGCVRDVSVRFVVVLRRWCDVGDDGGLLVDGLSRRENDSGATRRTDVVSSQRSTDNGKQD